MTKPKFINSIKELGKAYRDKRGRRPQAPVPAEFCPECHSLKRKPSRDCLNHNNYWIDKDEGLDRVILDTLDTQQDTDKDVQIAVSRLEDAKKHPERLKPFIPPPPFNMNDEIDGIAEDMVREIANKYIKVQGSWDGKQHQKFWYLEAQKMLKKLVKEYEKVCKESYK